MGPEPTPGVIVDVAPQQGPLKEKGPNIPGKLPLDIGPSVGL